MSFCFCYVQLDGEKTSLSDGFQTVHKVLLYLIFHLCVYRNVPIFTKSCIAIYSVVDGLRVCGRGCVRLCVYMYGAVDDTVRVLLLFSIKVSWPTENK